MSDTRRSRIWAWRSRLYDLCEGSQLRRARAKAALFRDMRGRVLFVAVGTGIDIGCFPPHKHVVGIDVSADMLRKAEPRRARYRGRMQFVRADALSLCFPDASFDTVVTSCTLCSVPEPVRVLRELHRVLRPGGRLLMFEHVRSRNPAFARVLDLMTLWSRLFGTEMNRDTLANAVAAGFRISRVDSVFLDIILAVHAFRPVEPVPTETRRPRGALDDERIPARPPADPSSPAAPEEKPRPVRSRPQGRRREHALV